MKTLLSIGVGGKTCAAFLLLLGFVYLYCSPPDSLVAITADSINLRDAWPSGCTRPPKTMSLAAGCRLLHGSKTRFSLKGDMLSCAGDPTQPPLLLQKQEARYVLINHNPAAIGDMASDTPWPSSRIDMPLASVVPLPGGGYRFTGAIRNKDRAPWDGFRFYVLDPGGSAPPVGNCIRGSVQPKQPLEPGRLRVFSCTLESSFVSLQNDSAEIRLAYGYRRRGEATALTALRLCPVRISLPLPGNQIAILSPGTVYREMQDNRPKQPLALQTHTVARIAGSMGSYYIMRPQAPWPLPADELYVRAAHAKGKSRIMQTLGTVHIPPQTDLLHLPPKEKGTPLITIPKSRANDGFWLAVSRNDRNAGPLLQWYDCSVQAKDYICRNGSMSQKTP